MEIRMKDKLFVAFFVPLVLAALYWWFWRQDAVKELDALRDADSRLVMLEDFPAARAAAQRRLEAAEADLARARKLAASVEKVDPSQSATFAERESLLVSLFRETGLDLLQCSSSSAQGSPLEGDFLAASGRKPVQRMYVLTGSYPAVRRALELIAERRLAVVPEKLFMNVEAGRVRWTLEVLL